jgi:drug/metabolite transporter (DMT)-like permease
MEAALHYVRPLDRRALLLVALLCVCWGLYQVSVKIAGAGVPPLMQAGLRSLGSAILVMGWCRLRNLPLFARDGTLHAGLLAGVLFALEFAFIYLGIAHTDVARGVLLIYLSPFVVAIGAHFLVPGDRLSLVKLIGLVAAFGGLALVLSNGADGEPQAHLLGDLFCVLGAITWGAATLVIKVSRLARISAEKILFYQLAVSALLLPPASLLIGEPLPDLSQTSVLLALAYQIIVVSFASYIVWFWLITQYAPSNLAAFTFLTPVSGVLFGALILDEPITGAIVAALILIGGGIYLVNRSWKPNR